MWEMGSMRPTTLAWRTPDSPNKPAHDSVLAADSMLQYDSTPHTCFFLPYFLNAALLFDGHVDKLAPMCKVHGKTCDGIMNADVLGCCQNCKRYHFIYCTLQNKCVCSCGGQLSGAMYAPVQLLSPQVNPCV